MQQPRNPLRKNRSDAQRMEAPPPPVKEAIDHGKNESEVPKPPYQQQKQEQQSQSQQHQDMGQLDEESNQNFMNQASQESDRKLEPISDKTLTKTDQSRIEQYLQSDQNLQDYGQQMGYGAQIYSTHLPTFQQYYPGHREELMQGFQYNYPNPIAQISGGYNKPFFPLMPGHVYQYK